MRDEELERNETEMRPNLLPCLEGRTDCNALKNGGCIAVGSMDFGGKPCPFYKSREQWQAEEKKRLRGN